MGTVEGVEWAELPPHGSGGGAAVGPPGRDGELHGSLVCFGAQGSAAAGAAGAGLKGEAQGSARPPPAPPAPPLGAPPAARSSNVWSR